MNVITSILAAAVVQLGSLTDFDSVVTGSVDRIEGTVSSGGFPGVSVKRTVGADLTVTDENDPPYWIENIPIVVTNWITSLEPVIETVVTPYIPPSEVTVTFDGSDYTIPLDYANRGEAEWVSSDKWTASVVKPVFFGLCYLLSASSAPYVIFQFSNGSGGITYSNYNRLPSTKEKGDLIRTAVDAAAFGDRLIDFSGMADDSGATHDVKVLLGTTPGRYNRALVERTETVTNGWTVVTNGYTVETIGYRPVTNEIERVLRQTSLVTYDKVSNLLATADINVPTGSYRPMATNSTAGTILGSSVDAQALQPRIDVGNGAVLRVDSLQSIVVGSRTNANGRVTGGRTLYGILRDDTREAVSDAVQVRSLTDDNSVDIAEVSVDGEITRISAPEFTKTGRMEKYIDEDLVVCEFWPGTLFWDMYSESDSGEMRYISRLAPCPEDGYPEGIWTNMVSSVTEDDFVIPLYSDYDGEVYDTSMLRDGRISSFFLWGPAPPGYDPSPTRVQSIGFRINGTLMDQRLVAPDNKYGQVIRLPFSGENRIVLKVVPGTGKRGLGKVLYGDNVPVVLTDRTTGTVFTNVVDNGHVYLIGESNGGDDE